MKSVFLLFFVFSHAVLYAQPDAALRKGDNIRNKMVVAFGGEKNINKVNRLEYTVVCNSFYKGFPVATRTTYLLDLQQRHIRATSYGEGTTVVKAIDAKGAWKETEGRKEPLEPEEKKQLEQILYFNFLYILQNQHLQFEHIVSCHYKGHAADIVRVTNPAISQHINLLVAKENAVILASSRQEPEAEYVFYKDESEYRRLNMGVLLPQVYQLFVNGELASEGRIVDILLR